MGNKENETNRRENTFIQATNDLGELITRTDVLEEMSGRLSRETNYDWVYTAKCMKRSRHVLKFHR